MNRQRPSRPVAETRAQQIRGLVAAITNPACRGLGRWWTEQEVAHAAATTAEDAEAAAVPALELCAGCPDREPCADRARLDRYTGLAAGAVYLNGCAHPAATTLQHPTPPHEMRRAG